jgi:EAL domain-containing protein (putative c-di-GMP-specific phosphodiesterase class I)
VIREACRQIRAWDRQGHPPLPIAVNTSPRQFWHGDFAGTVKEILQQEEVDGGRLDLEITESCLMRDVDSTVEILEAIKALGVRISLDDFGTGYSSLAVLMRLPLDTIKVDRVFVSDCVTDQRKAMITSAIISLAQGLELRIVAEGVELTEHAEFLLERGCRVMQGFLFSPPLTVSEFTALLARGRIDLEEKPGER